MASTYISCFDYTRSPSGLEYNSLVANMTRKGADPHFTYKGYTTLLPLNNPQLILFRDHVIDQVIIDPITNTNRTWLIISDPTIDIVTGDWKWATVRMRSRERNVIHGN